MPQFDTFTFFSQLFWVFLSFFLLYISLAYYLLPAIGVILKVRRRKLQTSNNTELLLANTESNLNYGLKSLLAKFATDKASHSCLIKPELIYEKVNSADLKSVEPLVIKEFRQQLQVKLFGLVLIKRAIKHR